MHILIHFEAEAYDDTQTEAVTAHNGTHYTVFGN